MSRDELEATQEEAWEEVWCLSTPGPPPFTQRQVGLGSGGGASERGLRGLQAPARGPEDAGPAPGAAAAKPGLILPGCDRTGGGKTSRGRQLLVPR